MKNVYRIILLLLSVSCHGQSPVFDKQTLMDSLGFTERSLEWHRHACYKNHEIFIERAEMYSVDYGVLEDNQPSMDSMTNGIYTIRIPCPRNLLYVYYIHWEDPWRVIVPNHKSRTRFYTLQYFWVEKHENKELLCMTTTNGRFVYRYNLSSHDWLAPKPMRAGLTTEEDRRRSHWENW